MKSLHWFFRLVVLISAIFILSAFGGHSVTNFYTVLHYTLDYSQTPALYYHDITLKIQVGPSPSIMALSGGVPVPHQYDPATGAVIINTDQNTLDVYVADAVISPEFGDYEITPLYDDKRWAWSQSFDDNTGFGESIDLYKSLGYQATAFIIGAKVDPTRTEYWIVDVSSGYETRIGKPVKWVTGIKELAEMEWGIGNHGWHENSSCDPNNDLEWEVLQDNRLLLDAISQSNNPTYKPISMAAPCFVSEYQDVLLNLRDNGVPAGEFQDDPFYLLFNESDNIEAPYIIDSDSVFTAGAITAHTIDFNSAISRDIRIEYDLPEVIKIMDWMALIADDTHHFWYNTFAHGDNNDDVAAILTYVHENYGRSGTDEAWIAPSERIYSYLLNKESVVVSFLGYETAALPVDANYHAYGTVTLDGSRASNRDTITVFGPPTGTEVPIQNVYNLGNGSYQVDLTGANGEPVSFGVNGYEIAETAVFSAGALDQVNLTNSPFTYDETRQINSSDIVEFLTHDKNPGLRIDANGQALGDTHVVIQANQDCTSFSGETVQRCFHILPENKNGLAATITFYFYESQIPAGQSCDQMEVYHYDGSQWSSLTRDTTFGENGRLCQPAPYTSPHAIQITGVTDFSPFVVAYTQPTAVRLNTFTQLQNKAWNTIGFFIGLMLLGSTAGLYWHHQHH